MKSSNDSHSLLPLLAPNSQTQSNQRRQRTLHISGFFRFITRRRLKFYIFAIVLAIIIIITILHRFSIQDSHRSHVHDNSHDITGNTDEEHVKKFNAHTLKTIIGKYVGPKLDWTLDSPNISDVLLNANNYDPDPKLGNDGRPVYLSDYPKDKMKLLYSINRFNLVVSDKISVDRKLPDPRKISCRRREFNINKLPSTSIIIVFHNEAWSTLARTVHSILNTSPPHLLAEILLVDDASNRTFLNEPLKYYMNNLSVMRGVLIRIIRSKDRIGLIRSRLLGVETAVGKVLTFIDAHCEATKGWLEPLLEQVHLDETVAACPIIDIINDDNFAFTRSFELHMGAYNWGLNFRWYPISRREIIESNGVEHEKRKVKFAELIKPFKTPIMAGGLFSINREYFNKIGKYDPQMDIWGGENIELSLRIWQCGGQIKIVPCSHVAHIFRKSSPYTFRPGKEVGDVLYTNLARVAEVWMDEWRGFFYAINPIVNKTLTEVGTEQALVHIEERKKLRHDLKCKSHKWFLDNIWPEHFFPTADRFFGKIRQSSSGRCLQRPIVQAGSGQTPVGAAQTARCSTKFMSHQMFVFSPKTGFLMTDENVCLDSGSNPIPSRQMILAPCSESQRQKWEHTDNHRLRHVQSGLCLASPTNERVNLAICSEGDANLEWHFIDEKWNHISS